MTRGQFIITASDCHTWRHIQIWMLLCISSTFLNAQIINGGCQVQYRYQYIVTFNTDETHPHQARKEHSDSNCK